MEKKRPASLTGGLLARKGHAVPAEIEDPIWDDPDASAAPETRATIELVFPKRVKSRALDRPDADLFSGVLPQIDETVPEASLDASLIHIPRFNDGAAGDASLNEDDAAAAPDIAPPPAVPELTAADVTAGEPPAIETAAADPSDFGPPAAELAATAPAFADTEPAADSSDAGIPPILEGPPAEPPPAEIAGPAAPVSAPRGPSSKRVALAALAAAAAVIALGTALGLYVSKRDLPAAAPVKSSAVADPSPPTGANSAPAGLSQQAPASVAPAAAEAVAPPNSTAPVVGDSGISVTELPGSVKRPQTAPPAPVRESHAPPSAVAMPSAIPDAISPGIVPEKTIAKPADAGETPSATGGAAPAAAPPVAAPPPPRHKPAVSAPTQAPVALAGYSVQISSVGSLPAARDEIARLQRAYGAILGRNELTIRPAPVSGVGTVYRVFAGTFADSGPARKLCSGLVAGGQSCLVVKH